MIEALTAQTVQYPLARVSERCMPEIMSESDCLGQVLVEPQRLRDRSGVLRYLQRMRHSCPVVIAVRHDEYLRFIFEAPERFAVQNPVAVPLKNRPQVILRLLPFSSFRIYGKSRPRGKNFLLTLFELFPDQHIILLPLSSLPRQQLNKPRSQFAQPACAQSERTA